MKKKDIPLPFLQPFCKRIFNLLKKLGVRNFPVSKESVERLNVNGDTEELLEQEGCRCIAYMLMIVFSAVLISIVTVIGKKAVIDQGRLSRKEAGEGSSEYDISVAREGEEPGEIKVTVSEQRYEGEALERFFEEVFLKLEKAVLADNVSADNVSGRILFPDRIEGTSVKVDWELTDRSYFRSNGAIIREAVREPTIVSITARLEYYDEVRIHSFPIRLVPEPEEDKTSFLDRLKKELEAEDRDSAATPWFVLPEDVDGEKIEWTEKDGKEHIWILLLGLGAVLAVVPAMRSEIAGKEKKREQEMMKDYPDIVSKFVLLTAAGMTCRGAWEKICRDYVSGPKRQKYAYEEMIRTEREMRFGAGEAKVYEDFGKRCGVPAYRRFGVILSNDLKRGSRDLTAVLEKEAMEALEGRTAEVRRQAGEAGTKLLLPMFGMLCLVFAIIMFPAFSSFGG